MTRVPDLHAIKSFVFDCDGVLLDSNRVKTEAFRTVAAQFGDEAAEELVRYHTEHGGVSRYRKFEYLLKAILRREADPVLVEQLSVEYGECVERDLLQCTLAPGLARLREQTRGASWMVVSGGDQSQLRRVFDARGLTEMFDSGIFGSPTPKDEILMREIRRGAICLPALYLGDSRFDHVASAQAGMDFVFVSAWSEFRGWQSYCAEKNIPMVDTVAALLPLVWKHSMSTSA